MKRLVFITAFLSSIAIFAQHQPEKTNTKILDEPWDAQWITEVTGKYSPAFSGVLLFRKTFDMDEVPEEFVVHVSADNRYQLFVNEEYTGNGPARSDIDHWIFETYDIAENLQPGKNIITAMVWNYGGTKPWGQLSVKTGFILQGNSEKEALVNSNHTWKVTKDHSYKFEPHDKEFFPHTTGVGPCERFYAGKHPWGWKKAGFDDSHWLPASEIGNGLPAKANPAKYQWCLTPRSIPALTHIPEQLDEIIRTKGIKISDDFLRGKENLVVPPNTKAAILIRQDDLTTAYPEVTFSNGKGSKVQMIYNEALYNSEKQKVERFKTKGLELIGYYDHFFPDGGQNRKYKPLWFRTYKFLQLNIETKNEPLTIHKLIGYKTNFPFELKASFTCSNDTLDKIFKAGWLTSFNSAHENYADCPYYEQLQYFGDLNISNLVTVLLSGDSRLMRNAIMQGEYSRKSGNLTTCSFPTNEAGKIIPYFSIAWIGIINNYWLYEGDTAFVKQFVPSIKAIMNWYKTQLNDQNMLGPMPHWNFVDCTPEWPWAPEKGSICEPEGTYSGNSSILTLQFVYGLQLSANLLSQLGEKETAKEYMALAEKIKKATHKLCWDETRKYIADTPEKNGFSQHANTFAVLTGVFEKEQAIDLLHRLYADESLLQMSLQFQAYLHKCLSLYGIENEYLNYIDTWKQLIVWGFGTFPEYPELNCRSDCHPWNAFPAYELLTIVCGIRIAEPGFGKVKINPHLGNLEWIEANMPHKNGIIHVRLQKTKDERLKGMVQLPENLYGTFTWKGKEIKIEPGVNRIRF